MKVAIIGGGISGLASALAFERYGITPVVFEKNGHIGDPVLFTSAILHIFNHFKSDPFKHLKKKYNLKLSPSSSIKRIAMYGPTEQVTIEGNLGYITNRMREGTSINNQLSSKLSLSVEFDSLVDIDDLKEEFDHILVATGNSVIPKKLDLWEDIFNTHFRSATVIGHFDTQSVSMWLNKDYAKNCSAYLIPISSKEANLNLVIDNITAREIDYYWEKFLSSEKLDYKIIETRDSSFNCGFLSRHQKDNIYLIGNAGGFVGSLVGLGQIKSIESGILAADSIVKGIDYDKLINPFVQDMKKFYELRMLLNTFTNQDLDRLINLLKKPTLKKLIYNNPLFKVKYGASIAKIYNFLNKVKNP